MLKALLPEAGTDIKGSMRSHAELLEASGYGKRPGDFDELLRMLDGELRLITPTDPEGVESEPSAHRPTAGGKYYQLTHDYLVHSLRDWLTRKQKETRRGRAELLLADRAAVWNARPENRQLPALWQWLQIRWLTTKKKWTPPQRTMMRKAGRHHALRGLVLALVLVALSATGLMVRSQIVEQSNAHHAAGLVQRLLDAETPQVPGIVAEMEGYRNWTDPVLRDEYQKAKAKSRQQLHAGLALLLPVDATQVEYLYGRLLDAEPHEVPVIRDALAAHKEELMDRLWDVVEQPDKGKESHRLRAAAALAKYDPDSQRWEKSTAKVVDDLVSVNAVYLGLWSEAFRPVKGPLLSPLSGVFRDRKAERTAERTLATNLLVDYAADQPTVLADLLMDADEKQFAVLYPKFKDPGERGLPVLTGEVDRKLPPEATEQAKEKLAKRQANAAVTLLRMNQPAKVWPLLKHSPDPRGRSYLIHRFGPLGADAGVLVKRLEEEPDVTIRRALILSLGPEEFGDAAWTVEGKKLLVQQLQEIYRTAADPGLHAASEWLLRSWKQDDWLRKINDEWAKNKEPRHERLKGIQQALAKAKEKAPPQWYVNDQGQTFVVIRPEEFLIGSPPTEAGYRSGEQLHARRIGRTFALATTPVTMEQFRRFRKEQFRPLREGSDYLRQYAPTPDCPVHGTSWYQAAEYCNWLSQVEGLPAEEWCYVPNKEGKIPVFSASTAGLVGAPQGQEPLLVACALFPGRIEEYAEGMKPAPGYLQRKGYRLPTESEMEYACRAGALTSRYYGETEELLGKYAWYTKNSGDRSWPVGSLKPNDLGLFDMHGNVWCWCQDKYQNYVVGQEGKAIEDIEDLSIVNDKQSRVLRGGSFLNQPVDVRSALRDGNVPSDRNPRCRLPSGEDFYALTALRLYHLTRRKAVEN